MSSECSLQEETPVEVVFETAAYESSEEPPMEEWSSLIINVEETNPKKALQEEGLYQPGSGEICTKYIAMSQSSVFRHPYYNYPAIIDPGIVKALLQPEPPVIYPDDGQELYLSLCKDMSLCPVRTFHRGLLDHKINLQYYGLNPAGVRAIGIALKYNRIVKVLNMTDNHLSEDSCYHLGDMLTSNSTLQELNLSGCKIGPYGSRKLFCNLQLNRTLRILNLDKNNLGDIGITYLAQAIFKGIDVKELFLSYNDITGNGLNVMAEALETHNKLRSIDLSWNNLAAGAGLITFLGRLGENKDLEDLNLAWNSLSGPRYGLAIQNTMKAPNLKTLNLSNNRFYGEAILNIINLMGKAKKITSLDLSYNPLTLEDALSVITKMKTPAVKLQKLNLDGVSVNTKFLEILNQMHQMKSKNNAVVSYGLVVSSFKPIGPDMRELVLNRAELLAKRPKKNPVDIALVMMQILKDGNTVMITKDFLTAVHASGAPLDEDLITEICNAFPGPCTAKAKTIDVKLLVDYIHRKWPERKLPPTPPPEPEPEIIPVKPKGKGKAKKK